MKKFVSLTLAALMLMGLLSGCGSSQGSTSAAASGSSAAASSAAGSKPSYEITMTSFDSTGTVACQLGEKFAGLVKDKSDGRIVINFYPDATLGTETEQYDLVKSGETQICYFADSFGSQIASGYDPSIIPFLFTSVEDVEKLYGSDLGQSIRKAALENGNVYLLGTSRRSPRLLTANKAINTPADLKGLKLRVPEIQAWVTVWNSMGASCTVVSWSETYSALQTGVVDGQENPIDNIFANKIYEVNKYIMKTEHLQSLNHWVVNNDFWTSLDAEDQELLSSCFQEAADWANGALAELSDKYFKDVTADGSVTVLDVDKAQFQAAAQAGIETVKATLQPEAQTYIDAYLKG